MATGSYLTPNYSRSQRLSYYRHLDRLGTKVTVRVTDTVRSDDFAKSVCSRYSRSDHGSINSSWMGRFD
ncbi:hypothetical protein TNCV_763731 [Trichonephila clavipes]|nr:hypothetical protein TNCV_763731 [Trichonephila clavipes]